MTTPADWYPDPEDPSNLRYWDGMSWTQHRTPRVPPPPPAQSAAAQPPETPAPASDSSLHEPHADEPRVDEPHADEPHSAEPQVDEPPRGAHRVPEPDQEPVGQSFTPTPGQPYDTHPSTSQEAGTHEARPGQHSYGAAPESSSFAPAPGPSSPSGDGPNKKLAYGIIGGGLAILVAIAVVTTLVVIRKNDATVTSAPATSSETSTTETTSETSSESSEAPTSSASETTTPAPPGAQGNDGDYAFSVTGTETGDTITSTVSDAVQTSADGMYYVVHLNVANTGTEQKTFVATFQSLNAAGQTFALDDTATAFLGGTIATIEPGAQVETTLVFDVPEGTEPDSIMLRADPSTAGVDLPLR